MTTIARRIVTYQGLLASDVVLATFVAALFFLRAGELPTSELHGTAFVLFGLAYSLPMLAQHRFPATACCSILAAVIVRLLIDPAGSIVADVAAVDAIYILATYAPRLVHRLACAAGVIAATVLTLSPTIRGGRLVISWPIIEAVMANGIFYITCLVIAYLIGLQRRAQISQVRKLREAAHLAESQRRTEAEVAVLEERSRIAREMHDIVAHTLSVVIAQADGGRYIAASSPEQAERALQTISDMSRDALKDIRSIIGVLRSSETDEAPTLPQPIDADLEALVDNIRSSGVRISFARTGIDRPLPVGVGNAVYRICQEALTNSLKHAGPDPTITVLLRISPTEILLQEEDDGRGAASRPDGEGHGLVGMEERARSFGGTVVAGPRPNGGFRVRATIPISSRSSDL